MSALLARVGPPARGSWLVLLFFGLLVGLGLLVYRDYGASWDEPTDHLNGLVNVKYVAERLMPERVHAEPAFQSVPALHAHPDKDHGPAFEVLVVVLNRLLTDGDTRSYLHLRHLLIFLFFVGGAWALYQLGRLHFGGRYWGLLTAVLLVLSPRLFAEAFFNGKDIVFMAAFALGMYTLARLLREPSTGRALAHAAVTAFALDVRVLGALLVAFTLSLLTMEAYCRPTERRRLMAAGAIYLPAAGALTILGWPYLWEAPVSNFLAAFERLSQFPWSLPTLYLGRFVPATHAPWHYVPVWLSVTTPVTYVLVAVLGLVGLSGRVRALLATDSGRFQLLVAGWLLVPVAMVIGLRSVLYDGWRHLYFIYPALLLLAVLGVRATWRAASGGVGARRWVGRAGLALLVAEAVLTAVRMVRMHPHQNVYFSFLPGPVAERLFERDYWGLSYYQGIRWVLAHDPAPQVYARMPRYVNFENVYLMLPPAERARLRLVTPEAPGPTYFLSTYRWHPQPYADSMGTEVHSIQIEGIKILSVFRKP